MGIWNSGNQETEWQAGGIGFGPTEHTEYTENLKRGKVVLKEEGPEKAKEG